jgi:GNAT superfamily N-acetyltransferase
MSDRGIVTSEVSIRKAGFGQIQLLEPLWLALHGYHANILPTLAGLPIRSAHDSWTRRRKMYERWLADDAGFVILAEVDDQVVGYAAIHIEDGLTVWQTGDYVAFWETMMVLPTAMGKGVGTAITNAVIAELQGRGITELTGKITEGNGDTQQFFRNRGGVPINRVLLYRLPAPEDPAVSGDDASSGA